MGAGGIAQLVEGLAYATVHVDGLDMQIEGRLTMVDQAGWLVVDTGHSEGTDADTGTITLLPLDRVIAVTAAYERYDSAEERQQRITRDPAFLDKIAELARPFADTIRNLGGGRRRGASAPELIAPLRDAGFDGYDRDDVEPALTLLEERGDIPPRRLV